MASRYLLIARTGSAPDAPAPPRLPAGMQPVLSTSLLQLYVNSDQRWRTWAGQSAIIVGNLHARSSTSAPRASYQELDERGLLSSFWGDYVTVRGEGLTLKVMRDPSGTLPCVFAVAEGRLYLASDVALLASALGWIPAVDWEQLARLLYIDELPEERTALTGVRELLAGHMLVFADSQAVASPIWSPWDHVAPDVEPTPEELKQCVRRCVAAVAAPFEPVLVGVSGGLDSSIMTACLSQSGVPTHPLTISTSDAHGDEAEFAQILCDHLGLPLIRKSYCLEDVDINRSCVEHLARPGGRAQLQAYDAAVRAASGQTGATVFLSGVGGDNVFNYTNSARPLVDLYLRRGLGTHLLTTLRDICRLTGCSVHQAIGQALAVPRGADPCKYRWRTDGRFLHPGRLAQLSRSPPSHPWLVGPSNCLPGRAAHIAMLLRAQHYIDGPDRLGHVTFLQPLLAQPIVEMCLGVPSWRAIAGGRDRAVARQAFAGSLPPALIERRGKGGPDGFAHQILRDALPDVRERLLGGVLAAQRILDLPALDAALREEHLAGGLDYVRILLLLDTEAWARHWIALRDEECPSPAG
jgi:asparagine synthase (glutamine-hydrolysing)